MALDFIDDLAEASNASAAASSASIVDGQIVKAVQVTASQAPRGSASNPAQIE